MAATIKNLKPAYELTVYSAMLAFIEKMLDTGSPQWEKDADSTNALVRKMPVIKTLTVTPDAATKKIYASGIVYDTTNQVKGATASLGLVALPREVLDKALGTHAKGALSYDKTNQQGLEFAFGYYCENSDGSLVYYLHPRCKLVLGEEEHNTSDDSDIDPEVTYDVEIMPTTEGVWRIRYYTADVGSGKKPLTMEEFFGALPYTVAEIEALPELEKANEGQ